IPGIINQAAPGGVNEAKLVSTPRSGSRPVFRKSCAASIVVSKSSLGIRDLHPCAASELPSTATKRTIKIPVLGFNSWELTGRVRFISRGYYRQKHARANTP